MSIMTKVFRHEYHDKGFSHFCILVFIGLLMLVSPGQNAMHDGRQYGLPWGGSS